MKVLIVEDEIMAQKSLTRTLTQNSFNGSSLQSAKACNSNASVRGALRSSLEQATEANARTASETNVDSFNFIYYLILKDTMIGRWSEGLWKPFTR